MSYFQKNRILVSHRFPIEWWRDADYSGWEEEIKGQRNNLAEKAGIPKDQIQGFRAPFLQVKVLSEPCGGANMLHPRDREGSLAIACIRIWLTFMH